MKRAAGRVAKFFAAPFVAPFVLMDLGRETRRKQARERIERAERLQKESS